MQVNFNTNLNSRPSFGMAKLTDKGKKVVESVMGSVPKLGSDFVYTEKNILPNMLKKKEFVPPEKISGFFKLGLTNSSFLNKKFAQNQLLTSQSQRAIKSFLKKQDKIGDSLTANALVDSVVQFFDKNISNEMISAKDNKKILDTVKEYVEPEKLYERLAIVSDKIFSK